MSELIERVAKAIFRSRYPRPEDEEFWPDRLDEIVNGPPLESDGYRDMARAAIEAMREPTAAMNNEGAMCLPDYDPSDDDAKGCWQRMIDAALAKVDA